MPQERAEFDPARAQDINLVYFRRLRDHLGAQFIGSGAAPVVPEKV
jgi:hypothetical protein